MTAHIRIATSADLVKLLELMQTENHRTKEWAEERTKTYLSRKTKKIFIAEIASELVGYLGIKEKENHEPTEYIIREDIHTYAAIEWIMVHPHYRHQHIGHQLLAAGEQWAKERGQEGVWLDCKEKLIPFYTSAGFQVRGSYDDSGDKRFVFSKKG